MKFLKALGLLPALIIVIVLRCIRPLVKIRFGGVWSFRLGHLVGNNECYLSERDAGMHKGFIDFFYFDGQSSHPLIEKQYRRQLNVLPRWFVRLICGVNRLFPGFQKFEIGPQQIDRDINNLWEKYAPHLHFAPDDERKGERLLKSLGIPPGAKWACLIVRDSAFMKKHDPNHDYSYHDYRDSEVSTYVATCWELIQRGYYVIRMGKVAEKRLPIDHPQAIDYPFHPEESDFGQFYLGAKCALAFGASTGFMAIPQVFHRPTAVVNFVPIEYISSWLRGIVIWKHHIRDGKRMSMREIFHSGAGQFMAESQFTKAGITLEDNTSREIYDAVIELEEGLPNHIQLEVWREFPNSISPFNYTPLHGIAYVRIGREFLKGYL